jgi:hypothetical protein
MVEPRRGLHLVAKGRAHTHSAGLLSGHDLDGDLHLLPNVPAEPNLAHATFRNGNEELKGAELDSRFVRAHDCTDPLPSAVWSTIHLNASIAPAGTGHNCFAVT